jgi:hypothetical protein
MTWQKEWKVDNSIPPMDLIIAGCEIVGDLALDFTDEGWNIYHVPTGACFDKAVPEGIYDKQPLLDWMKKVQEVNPTAWTMLRLLKPENYDKNGTQAKKIIQEWCLSVPVL